VKLKSMPSQRSFDDFLHSHHPAVAVLELARRSVTFSHIILIGDFG
jgi:hypothetical protein